MYIDSHCHLDGTEYAADREQVIQRARDSGVNEMVAIGGGTTVATLDCGLQMARAWPNVWATIGIHPHEARHASEEIYSALSWLASEPRIIAVGEIGLDYYYDHSTPDQQRAVFARQLHFAQSTGLPVSIHCRDAWPDCFAAIDQANRNGTPVRGVFHCFTGGPAEAEQALARGFYLSFSGMLTFAKAEGIRSVAQQAPEDRILIETDSPYLAPVPHRGRRNEPAYVVKVAERLGQLRGWTLERTATQTTANFRRLFTRTAP